MNDVCQNCWAIEVYRKVRTEVLINNNLYQYRRLRRESRSPQVSTNFNQLQTHQMTVRNRHFCPRRLGYQTCSHTRTHHLTEIISIVTQLQINWESVKSLLFLATDASPLQVRIKPVENLPTVVVIPIPAHTAEFANLFLSLTIVSWNLATPTLDTTENQSLVDLLAYMKTNLVTYNGVSLINLLHSPRPGTHTKDEERRWVVHNPYEILGTHKNQQICFINWQISDSWTCEPTGSYNHLLPM